MPLPIFPLSTDTVTIDGKTIEIRSLSRAEAVKLTTGFVSDEGVRDIDGAEIFTIAHGAVGVTEAEAQAWREGTDNDKSGLLTTAILELSGLTIKKDAKGKVIDPKPRGSAS